MNIDFLTWKYFRGFRRVYYRFFFLIGYKFFLGDFILR